MVAGSSFRAAVQFFQIIFGLSFDKTVRNSARWHNGVSPIWIKNYGSQPGKYYQSPLNSKME